MADRSSSSTTRTRVNSSQVHSLIIRILKRDYLPRIPGTSPDGLPPERHGDFLNESIIMMMMKGGEHSFPGNE